MSKKYKILALCGGGVRGVMTGTIIERLEHDHPGFLKGVDLLAGTSAGSNIISLLLSDYSGVGLRQRLVDFMKHYQPEKKNRHPDKPMFDIENFVDAQMTLHPGNPSLSSFDRSVLMTAFQLGNRATGRPWDQIIFNNLPGSDTAGVGIVDATVSSSVMGGMYGTYQFEFEGETYYTVDGAFAHHDPSLIAIAYAMFYQKVPIEDIVVVDIGTGYMPQSLGEEQVTKWGCRQWVHGPEDEQNLVSPLLANQPFSIPVLDIILNGTSTTLLEQQAGMMLGGNRYVNINPQIKNISETDTAAIPYLIEQGAKANLAQANELIREYWV